MNSISADHRVRPSAFLAGAHYLADGRLRIVLEAYQRPPTPLSILTLRNRLLLPKVRAFVDYLQQHWMRPRPPL
jgi:DNA-binding transcriptional LysR family regulator